MGEVIRKGAAADDVLGDVALTLTRARAKGDVWKVAAEEKLGPVEKLVAVVAPRLKEADAALALLIAALDSEDAAADDLLGAVSDDIWNKVGRPASDPVLAIMFPGGIAYYTDGSDDEQPDRMELLAEFLDAGLHPGLDAKASKGHAKTIREAAQSYRKRVDAVQKPRARVKMLTAMKLAVARVAQSELANLKRRYKSENLSEGDIHQVIPAHTRSAAAKPVAQPPAAVAVAPAPVAPAHAQPAETPDTHTP